MILRRLKPAPMLLVVLLLGVQTAAAAPLPQPGGFGISPARRDVIAIPPLGLTSTNVVNHTSDAYRVTVFPAILTQTLTGAFDFAETPANLHNSELVLTAAPGRFQLAPGANQLVDLHWNLLPLGRKWIVMGVVFQGVSEGQTGSVHVVTRLLSVNFLRVPGLTNINGDFIGLYPQQVGKRVLRFTSRVENTGNRFWAPTDGRLTIRDGSSTVVYSAPWSGSVVIPGAKVDFPVDVHQLLPAGRYTATTTMRFGAHRRSRSTRFTLVGPNQLPTPAITIRAFNATGEIGSPAKLTAQIISSGTAPASLTVHLYLANSRGVGGAAGPLATATASYSNLPPGRRVQLSRSLGGGLRKGFYRAIATWTDPTGAQHTVEADFTALPPRSAWDSFWKFIGDHLVLFIGLLVIALLLIVAEVVRRMRGRQQQMEAELSAARAQLRDPRRHGPAVLAVGRPSRRPAPPAAPAAEAPEPEPEPEPELERAPVAEAVVSTARPGPAPESWVPPWERDRDGR